MMSDATPHGRRVSDLLESAPPNEKVWERAMTLIHLLMNGGGTEVEAARLLSDDEGPLASEIRDYCQQRMRSIDQQLAAWWQRADMYRTAHAKKCGQARWAATQLFRGGRAESTNLAVMLGLYDLAEKRGRFDLELSMRSISEASGVGSIPSDKEHGYTDHKTTRAALRRLADSDLIELNVGKGGRYVTDAGTFVALPEPERLAELLLRRRGQVCPPSIPFQVLWMPGKMGEKLCSVVSVSSTWRHVIWEAAGLGMTAARIWHLLRDHRDLSNRQIADRLGVSSQAVRDQLAKLVKHGLWDAEHRRLTERSLDDVSIAIGVAERREDRRMVNLNQRRVRLDAIVKRTRADRGGSATTARPPAVFDLPTRVPTRPVDLDGQERSVIAEAVAAMLGADADTPTESLDCRLERALSGARPSWLQEDVETAYGQMAAAA